MIWNVKWMLFTHLLENVKVNDRYGSLSSRAGRFGLGSIGWKVWPWRPACCQVIAIIQTRLFGSWYAFWRGRGWWWCILCWWWYSWGWLYKRAVYGWARWHVLLLIEWIVCACQSGSRSLIRWCCSCLHGRKSLWSLIGNRWRGWFGFIDSMPITC